MTRDIVQETMDRVNSLDEDYEANDLPPITGGEKCKTIVELREHVLAHAGILVDQYLNIATGREAVRSRNSHIRNEVWEVVKELIVNEGERVNVNGDGTPDGILRAVESGQCSIQEASKLLMLYKEVKEIENNNGANSGDYPFIQFTVKQADGAILEGTPIQPAIDMVDIQ